MTDKPEPKYPKRYTMTTFKPIEQLPHVPGSLSSQALSDRAAENNDRANRDPNTGEVLGTDTSSGESLVRVPGNKVVRVSTNQSTPGSSVSIDTSLQDKYNQIRKRGTKVSSTLVQNTGFKVNEEGRNVSTIGVTRSVEDIGLLRDNCTPPDVKIRIIQSAAAQGVFVDENGNYIGSSSAIGNFVNNVLVTLEDGRQIQVPATTASMIAIQNLEKQAKAQGSQQTSLPEYVSLASLGGTTTEGFTSTSVPLLWKCENGVCVEAEDGFYPTKELCAQNCGQSTWNCVNGTCVQIAGLGGQFKSQAECVAGGCNTRYSCVLGEPVPDPNGQYPSLEAAIAGGCYWGWTCVGGECVPQIGGIYKSKTCCQQNCLPLGPVTSYAVSYGNWPGSGSPNYVHLSVNGNAATLPDLTAEDPKEVWTGRKFNLAITNLNLSTSPGDAQAQGFGKTTMFLMVFDAAREHTFSASQVQVQFQAVDLAQAQAVVLDNFLRLSQTYGLGPGSYGRGFQTYKSLNLADDFDLFNSAIDAIGFYEIFENRMTYEDHVAALDPWLLNRIGLFETPESDPPQQFPGDPGSENQPPLFNAFLAQTSYATKTVEDLGSNQYRVTWTDVTFQVPLHRWNLENWFSPVDAPIYHPRTWCPGAYIVSSVPYVTDPELTYDSLFLASYFPSFHWPEWTQFCLSIEPSTQITGFSASAGAPFRTWEQETGQWGSLPSVPWSLNRTRPFWTDPKWTTFDSNDRNPGNFENC